MTTALQVVTRALKLINVPGRGASLAPEAVTDGLDALTMLLSSKAVSKLFVPGIKRHFFPLLSNQSIYSYGAGSQFDLRSDAFGGFIGDPAAIKIEDAYVLQGSTITNNELVEEYRFGNQADWVLTGGMTLTDNNLAASLAVGTATQIVPADMTGLTTYTLRMAVVINAGTVIVNFRNNGVVWSTFTLDSSGNYEFDTVWIAGTLPDVRITSAVTTDFSMTLFSLVPRGTPRLELPDGVGTSYPLRQIDQRTYNQMPIKGRGSASLGMWGMLYSRSAGGAGEIRLVAPVDSGDILVMDVTTDSLLFNEPGDDIGLNDEAMLWLTYALADLLAGTYGKMLKQDQRAIKQEAWDMLTAGTYRANNLRMDAALVRRRRFSIATGESN